MALGVMLNDGCALVVNGCIQMAPCETTGEPVGPPEDPVCCQLMGCCFDKANAYIQGDVYWQKIVYGVAGEPLTGCVGTLLGTVTMGFSYKLKMSNFTGIWDQCGEIGYVLGSTTLADGEYVTWHDNEHHFIPVGQSAIDLLEEATAFSQVINIHPAYTATTEAPQVWAPKIEMSVTFSYVDLSDNTIDVGLDFLLDADGNQLDQISVSGTCAGFEYDPAVYCYPVADSYTSTGYAIYDHYETTNDVYIDAEIVENYCCRDNEPWECFPTSVPIIGDCA